MRVTGSWHTESEMHILVNGLIQGSSHTRNAWAMGVGRIFFRGGSSSGFFLG